MKLKDKQALRDASVPDLEKKFLDLTREFSLLTLQKKVGKLKNVRMLSTLRQQQALVKTLITEKQHA